MYRIFSSKDHLSDCQLRFAEPRLKHVHGPHNVTVLSVSANRRVEPRASGPLWKCPLRRRLRVGGLVCPSARFPDALPVRHSYTQQTAPPRAPLRASAHTGHARFLAVHIEDTWHRRRPGSPLPPSWPPLTRGHRRCHVQPRGSVLPVLRFQGRTSHAACARCGLGGSACQPLVRRLMDIWCVAGLGLLRRKLSEHLIFILWSKKVTGTFPS